MTSVEMAEPAAAAGAGAAEAGEPPPWRALVFVASDADAAAAIRWALVTVILAAAAVLAALCA